jgi:hypothetical protein
MRRALLVVAVLAMSMGPFTARAGDNDLVLARLGSCVSGGTIQTTCDMMSQDVVPNNQLFRSLASELGVVIAPRFTSPSDTLGYSGFQFSSDFGLTSISNDQPWWCATEEANAGCSEKPTRWLPTFAVFARKGMWLPLPSFELGGGAMHVGGTDSMWAAQAYAKFAVHEGFHTWWLPSLAARGAVSRLMGSEQIDLTVASLDISISKSFGIKGTVNASPYFGWNYLWIVPRSEVIDKTPNVDAVTTSGDIAMNFVFPDQDNILRQRWFFGLKLKYYVFALTFEGMIATAGDSMDDRSGTTLCDDAPADQQHRCDAVDQSGTQQSYTVSISLDF